VGAFELRAGGSLVVLPPSGQRVVAFLALRHRPAARSSVAGTLWPEVPEDRAMANLRSALWRLRRPGLRLLQATGESLALSPDVEVDLDLLVAAARRCIDHAGSPEPTHVDRLAGGADVLGDWYDDWVQIEREHFRQLRLQALEQLALEYASAGHYGRATEAALAAIASEPLRESAHRALIVVHLGQGNRSEAIRQYTIYRRLMHEELDLEPSGQMDEVMGPLLTHVPGGPGR